ncbi:hypothetical protein CRG98_045201 [Punica granatum]|uniref:Uncharacterized protein n=1 Tax=Punica granatum TaxID=22663 RepID=A0A2I0HRR0_PUNGR|nr:hypothetical protein CRG98_045201 [Punica granatum]
MPVSAAFSDPLLDPLELRDPTRQCDPSRVIVPMNLLGLPQELPEQRVVEVYHRHHDPARAVPRLAHVHCKVALRDVVPDRYVPSLRILDPGEERLRRVGLLISRRVIQWKTFASFLRILNPLFLFIIPLRKTKPSCGGLQ